MVRIITLILFFLSLNFIATQTQAQKYNIEVQIEGIRDTNIFLAHYFDGRIFADDTTRLNSKGIGVFSKPKLLPQGIYVIYMPNQKYFDLLVGEDQSFSISTNPADFVASMKITGAQESEAFHSFQQFMKNQNRVTRKLQQEYKNHKEDPKAKKDLKQAFKEEDQKVKSYISKLEKEYPSPSFVSRFARFTLSVDIPDFASKIPQSTPDRDKEIKRKSYYYNKNHYFDNVDFSDDRYLRTPILKNKLNHFFNKVLLQHPDTIVMEAQKVIEKARTNKDCFQYIVQFTLNNSIKSKIMGMDAAFVALAKKYYLNGQAPWADSTLMSNIRERVIKLQYNLIGSKAQNLKMQTLEGEMVSLDEVNAEYTVLYFWEPDCGHCKTTTPRLKKEIYDKYNKRGVKVFAVYTQDKKEEWEKFIAKNELYDFINCYDPNYQTNFRIFYDVFSTPTMFLLDKDKKIVAKRIDIDTLKDFLNHELEKL